jgi:hypothetical protein
VNKHHLIVAANVTGLSGSCLARNAVGGYFPRTGVLLNLVPGGELTACFSWISYHGVL